MTKNDEEKKHDEIKKAMIRQVVGYSVEKPTEKEISFVMDKKGVKKIVKNEIGKFSEEVKEIPGLDEIKSGFNGALPKIPVKILLEINQFFKKHRVSEAMTQIFWDRTKKEYFVYVPEQEVTGASVHAIRNKRLEREHLLVMDIHSHNTMNAFFSGIDDDDEKETRLFGVIGKIDEKMGASILCRAGKNKVSLEEIFDIPTSPEEWDDRIRITPVAQVAPVIGFGSRYNYGNTYAGSGYSWANDDSWILRQIMRLPTKKIRKLIKKVKNVLDRTTVIADEDKGGKNGILL